MTDNYAASLARDAHRDWDRDVHRDPQPVTGSYRMWDQSGIPERHEAEEAAR